MTNASKKRSVKAYRDRFSDHGLVGFEVRTSDADRTLIQSLGRQRSEHRDNTARLRAALRQSAVVEPTRTRSIVAVLRGSPLVGADLDLEQPLVCGSSIRYRAFSA
jgi:hypothetical protein